MLDPQSIPGLIDAAVPRLPAGPVQALARLLERFVAAETLRDRIDGFEHLLEWQWQSDDTIPASALGSDDVPVEWRRLALLVTALERVPELRRRFNVALAAILRESRSVSVFADLGMPSEHGLLHEALSRVRARLLPSPRDDSDLAKVILRIFPAEQNARRISSMPAGLFRRLGRALAPPDVPDEWRPVVGELCDALALLAGRVQTLGLSPKLRARTGLASIRQSPFFKLPRETERLIHQMESEASSADALDDWRRALADCRVEADRVEQHLEATGVDLSVVFALDVIRKSLDRMEVIVDALVAPFGPGQAEDVGRLIASVVHSRLASQRLRTLAHDNLHLLARRIVEQAGRTGEHYVANTRREYWHMWWAAAGGGLLTVGTAAIKMWATHLGLPAFPEGLLVGLNYAGSFILLQVLGLILATKQPSMTAAALAGIVREHRGSERLEEIVSYFARICRSQLAAALGNVLVVAAGALVFDQVWRWWFGASFLDLERATYALKSLSPVSTGTVAYATLTGVILWLASVAGGWIDNWYVYNRLPEALAEHRLGRLIGHARLARLVEGFSKNLSGWGVSIALGFMLGMAPEIGRFLGVPIDVRHVTLNTGIMALGIAGLGTDSFREGWLLAAAGGIAVTFVLNLSVSFALALRVALQAYDVPARERWTLLQTFGRRFLKSPGEFLLPPSRQA